MPTEEKQHEGTWLQWPHKYEYGVNYRDSIEATWVAMTKALVPNEKVHIIAYNDSVQWRADSLLTKAGVSLTNVDFKLFPTNDVWVRDNGPIFVLDGSGNLEIEDWGFNGWGGKYNYTLDNPIPTEIATSISMPVVNLNSTMTIEGGAYELDGNGLFIACKSSILSQTAGSIRNPGMTQAQAETILKANLGIKKFIWLNGITGQDITDQHIDGFVHFANDSTIVTMKSSDLTYWLLSSADITTLLGATNVNNKAYKFVYVPLTKNNVVTTSGNNLGEKGSYANYYVANNVVLVPNYNDPNDVSANNIIQGLYPGRTVVGIDVRDLYQYGGMIHCVTQQQPYQITTEINNFASNEVELEQNSPNPFNNNTTITFILNKQSSVKLEIYNALGQKVKTLLNSDMDYGKHSITINSIDYKNGIYSYILTVNNSMKLSKKMVVLK